MVSRLQKSSMRRLISFGKAQCYCINSCMPAIEAFQTDRSMQIVVIIIIKKGWCCNAGREQLTPYQSKDPSLTIPIHKMKEKEGKIVGDKKGARS